MIVLSREEMYACDKATIEQVGIPGKELMENAGRNSAIYIKDNIIEDKDRVIIFCGAGNNGGDGFVIGRYLKQWGYDVLIVLAGNIEKMSPETKDNYEACQKMDIPIQIINDINHWHKSNIDLCEYDILVDSVLGVGFRGELRGWLTELFAEINQAKLIRVAIDISSGTDANNGRAENGIIADYTLTMAAMKYGSLLGAGRTHAGKLEVMDIGMPYSVIADKAPSVKLLTEEAIVFPERKSHSHKGSYGKIAIFAGSPGFSGAAIMACRSALRAGAGLITLFHPKGMELIFETQLLEVMTKTIPDTNDELLRELDRFDAILTGPGIGKSEQTKSMVQSLLQNWQKPMVIDADGLNIISENSHMIKYIINKDILLTPHIGEFARLSCKSIQDIENAPVEELESFCKANHVKVLLKSSTTIFSDGTETSFDITGNDGLATGGSGDVLAGIIISFAGQGLPLSKAAVAASWLLGTTAEKLAFQRKPASIIPSDIIDNLFRY